MPAECNIPESTLEHILNVSIAKSRERNKYNPLFMDAEFKATCQLIEMENAALLMAQQPPTPMSNTAAGVSYLGNPALMWQQYTSLADHMDHPEGQKLWVAECVARREDQKVGLIMFWSGKQI